MENKNKIIRNPLLAVGKVFKYEIICGARIILPMYIIQLALSLLMGLFVMDSDLNFMSNSSHNIFTVIKGIIFALTMIMYFVIFIVTIIQIENRFKKSMLGDEAYMNLTLPVTVGEHLWGRYLANAVWAISYAVVTCISFLLICIKAWGDIGDIMPIISNGLTKFKIETGFTIGETIFIACINAFMIFMLLCTFGYMCNTISKMIGKNKTITTILIFILCFFLYTNISDWIIPNRMFEDFSIRVLYIPFVYNFIWVAVMSVITRVIFYTKLNLE